MNKTVNLEKLKEMFPHFGHTVHEVLLKKKDAFEAIKYLDRYLGMSSRNLTELLMTWVADEKSYIETMIKLKKEYDEALEYVRKRLDRND